MPASATTPELQPLRCRLAAYSRWANVSDRPAETAPAREAFLGQFDAYPNPEAARKAYFTRLSLASAMARAAKAAGRGATSAQKTEVAPLMADVCDSGGSTSATLITL